MNTVNWKAIKSIANEYAEAVITDCFGMFSYNKAYCSPFRADKHPSCKFFKNKEGILLLHDFATGEKHDMFKFAKEFKHQEFADVIKELADNYGIKDRFESEGYLFKKDNNLVSEDYNYLKQKRITELNENAGYLKKQIKNRLKSEDYEYDIEICHWSKFHLLFWEKYLSNTLLEEIQKEKCIRPIRKVVQRKIDENKIVKHSKPIYEWNGEATSIGFVFYKDYKNPEGPKQFYFPFADKKKKFKNHFHCEWNNFSETENYKKASSLLDSHAFFVAKSAKDFFIWKMYGLPTFAITGESSAINWTELIDNFIDNCNSPKIINIYILGDKDEPGIKAAENKKNKIELIAENIFNERNIAINPIIIYPSTEKDMSDQLEVEMKFSLFDFTIKDLLKIMKIE